MPSFNNYKYVFEPLKAGRHTLKNRIMFSPMVCDFTDAISQPTPNYVDFVEEQAKTGVAMVTLGATPINFTTAPDFPAELNVTEDTRVQGLVLLAKAAHRHGAKLCIQLEDGKKCIHVFRRALDGGDRAYMALNLGETAENVTIWPDAPAEVRDVWAKRDLGRTDAIRIRMEPHTVRIFRVSGK